MLKKTFGYIFILSSLILSTTASAEVLYKTNAKVNAVFVDSWISGIYFALVSNYTEGEVALSPNTTYNLFYGSPAGFFFVYDIPSSAVTGNFKDSFALDIADICDYTPSAATCGPINVQLTGIESSGKLTGMSKTYMGDYTITNAGNYEYTNAYLSMILPGPSLNLLELPAPTPYIVRGEMVNHHFISLDLVKGQANYGP